MGQKRLIVHVDMDAFFAAIEQRDNPCYRSKPVVVGSDPKLGRGRGVVSTCSYEARKFGIHSAMPISIAYRKCPHAVFLPVNMDKYIAVSEQIYRIFYSYTPDVEPISVDEAFLDISCSYKLFGTPLKTCELLKEHIKNQTGLTASIGLAPTKLAAKIASDLKKPDGLVEVSEEGLLDFLRPLEIRKIWGLGAKSEKILNGMGIRTIGELAGRAREEMAAVLGANGSAFWELANGVDERPVCSEGEAKSIGNEHTFEEDTRKSDAIEGAIMALCEKVSSRLRHQGLKCRTLTLKIRLEGFLTYTRSSTFKDPTNFTEALYKKVKDLYNNFDTKGRRVRLVGVKSSNFIPAGNCGTFFDDTSVSKTEAVHKAIDRIEDRFGYGSIFRASSGRKD